MKSLSLFVFLLATATQAFAIENRMNYNFVDQTIYAYGIYKPGAEAKTGLQAELDARKEALKFASDSILTECKGEENLVSGWRNSFKSLGSTIYPKGFLEIELSSRMRDVFKAFQSTKVQVPKLPAGDVIAFKLPNLSPQQTPCGIAKLRIEGQIIHFIPIAMTKSDAPMVTIPLTISDNQLKASPSDEKKILSFFKDQITNGHGTEKKPIALPISIK